MALIFLENNQTIEADKVLAIDDYTDGLQILTDNMTPKLDQVYLVGRATSLKDQKTVENLFKTAKIYQTTSNLDIRALKLCQKNSNEIASDCIYSLSRELCPGDLGSPVIGEYTLEGTTHKVLLGMIRRIICYPLLNLLGIQECGRLGWYMSTWKMKAWLKGAL